MLYVGDGAPSTPGGQERNAALQAILDTLPPPHVRIAPWNVLGIGNGATEADQAAQFSAADSIVAVVGHAGSKTTLLAAPIYREAGVPLIVPTATARELRGAGAGLFMLAPPDDSIGAYLADHAVDSLGAQRIGMFYIADPYGEGVHEGVMARMRARGDSLAGDAALSGTECGPSGTLAMTTLVRAFVRRVQPDAVILVLPQLATYCAFRALVVAAPGIRILTGDSYVPTESGVRFTDDERSAVRYLVFWRQGSDALSRAFASHMRARTNEEPTAGQALIFDAFLLVAAAAREGYTTRAGIATWLSLLGTPGHPPFQGVTGPIDFQRPRTTLLRMERLSDLPRDPPARAP